VTFLDITFVVRVVGQLLSYPCQDHWDVVVQILKYIKKALGKGFIYKIKEILKLLGILTLTGHGHQAIEAPLQGTMFLLEAI